MTGAFFMRPDMSERPPWRDILTPATVIAIVALWAWGVGFWMGTYFVPRSSFEILVQRVLELERAIKR